MKGVVYLGDSEVEVREIPKPEPGPTEVVIEMKVGGLCGSDLHKYHSSRAWAQEREGMIAGHEPTGVVAELGRDVKNLSVGDRVCVYHSVGCGHCSVCLSGTPVFCDNEGAFGRTRNGCHADFMVSEARYCLPLPDSFSFAVGAQLACTAGTAFSATSKVPSKAGDTFVVFGLGPVGLTVLLFGEAMGYKTIGVDVHPFRVSHAEGIAKGTILNGREVDPVEAVRELTGGKGAEGVVECSGNEMARAQAASAARLHGTVVYVGAGAEHLKISFLDILRKALTLKGNSVYSMADYFRAVEFLETHKIPLDDMVTHRFKIDQAVEAFKTFDSGDTGKVIFDWEN